MAVKQTNRTAPLNDSTKASANADKANSAQRFMDAAKRFEGQSYKWGGGHDNLPGKVKPVDCSGLITHASRLAGLKPKLEGTAKEIQKKGTEVPLDEKSLKPGDLVFQGKPATHVGIYMGNGQVLHASNTAGKVVVEKLSDAIGRGAFDSARRVFAQPANAEPARAETWKAPSGAKDGVALHDQRRTSINLPGT